MMEIDENAMRYLGWSVLSPVGSVIGIPVAVDDVHGWDAPRTMDQLEYYLRALARQGKPRPDRLVLTSGALMDLEADCRGSQW